MTVSSAQLRALVALGITGEQLLAVVDIMEGRNETRDERNENRNERNEERNGRDENRNEERNEKRDAPLTNAERSRRWRIRHRNETATQRNVTRNVARNAPSSPSSPPSAPSVSSPCITPPSTPPPPPPSPPSSAAAPKQKRGTRLPTEWEPGDKNLDYAVSKGLFGDKLRNEVEKFRNYWNAKAGQGAARIDWDATWRNWILTAIERGAGGGNGNRGPPAGRPSTFRDVINELSENPDDEHRPDYQPNLDLPGLAGGRGR